MKFNPALGLLALVGGASSSLTVTTNTNKNPLVSNQNTTVVPNTFIVELQPDFHPDLQPKERFAKTTPGAKPGYSVRQQYNSTNVFYGVSVSFDNPVDLGTLRQTAGVKNAWKVAVVPRPEPYGLRAAPEHGTGKGSLPNYRGSSQVNQPLVMGNVQKLHNQGIKGKGVQIALIDSGVDYRHPALGGGFGKGYKIAFGYDFVGDDYDGSTSPAPGPDPLATCVDGGHGTHTTGIVGMEDPSHQGFGLVGVAPEATLGAYRIFGCEGGATSDVIVEAMLKAASDGASIISMSLGEFDIWEEINPFEGVVNGLTQQGVAVVAAIGNFGTAGVYSTSSPAISTNSLSVGSIENDVYPTVYTAHDDQHRELSYISVFPANSLGRVEVFLLGTGLDEPINANVSSGCYQPAWDALANATVNWNTTTLLVSLVSWCGTNWYSAADAGAQSLLIYQGDEELIVVDEPGDSPQQLYLDSKSSQQIIANIAQLPAGKQYYLTFDGKTASDSPSPVAGTPSDFSSFGPTVELSLAPKISAPGGNILSTWPLEGGGYAVLSGTSMATPFAAASLALLKSQQPHLSVPELYARLMTTAVQVNEPSSELVASTARQGAGLVDVYAAVEADTVISPSELTLLDSETPAPQKITITNQSKSRKTYSLQHSPGSLYRIYYNYLAGIDNFDDGFPPMPLDVPASAQFSQSSLTLGPGQSATVQVQIKPQHDDWPWSLPVYGGFVKITSDDSTYSVPYIGVPYNGSEVGPIMHNVTTQLPYNSPCILKCNANDLFLADGQMQTASVETYNFSTDLSQAYIPVFRVDVLLPSRFIRFDLVPANVSFVPTLYGFDPNDHVDYQPPSQAILPGFLGVPTYGQLFSITVDDAPPNSPTLSQPVINHFFAQALVSPTLTNDDNVSYNITSGDYRPLIRALKWNGNETNPDDYESWLGPVIRADIPSDEFPTGS